MNKPNQDEAIKIMSAYREKLPNLSNEVRRTIESLSNVDGVNVGISTGAAWLAAIREARCIRACSLDEAKFMVNTMFYDWFDGQRPCAEEVDKFLKLAPTMKSTYFGN